MRERLSEQIAQLVEKYSGREIKMPCANTIWVSTEKTIANDYNPNHVPHDMMKYLTLSIKEDGLTQPVVAWHDKENDVYVIVDGFHRYTLLKNYFQCNYIPVALVDLSPAERMAATVLHNRARGKHEVALTTGLVSQLSALGWSDVSIAKHLGMEAEEILRMKQSKGIASYYSLRSFSRAWEWHESNQRVYLRKNVYEAVCERLEYIFAKYSKIVISVSGGKDSTCMFDIAYKILRGQGREIHAFFLDQEAEYQSTIDVIKGIMARPGVIPHWYQVPCYMTNATSYEQDMLYAWGEGEEWMRAKDPVAIHSINSKYPQRFYDFIDWFEGQWDEDTCFLVGLRSEESLNRYRAVIKNPGIDGILWSTGGKTMKFYPIYDWSFDDIFYYFYHNEVEYNRIYDFMHSQDPAEQITKYRVSNLIHEKAYGSLASLQEFEPETYERLMKRLKGVQTAARYANESTVYSTHVLPSKFGSWLEYRDYLLQTIPDHGRKHVFEKRFSKQEKTESVYRQQCRQLLLNDWENNLPVASKAAEEQEDWRAKWMELL